MDLEVSIPYQAHLELKQGQLRAVGSKNFLLKVGELFKTFGAEIKSWPVLQNPRQPEELLLNEFIRKAQGDVFVFSQDELCHCRMIKTETVKNAVKAGCRTQADVSRVTLAGTGCGSCRPDIEAVIKALTT